MPWYRDIVDVSNERRTYSAFVEEIHLVPAYKGDAMEEVIWLHDVRDIYDNKVSDGGVITKTKAMTDAGVEEGCLIEFEARMKTTWSGENRVSHKFLRPTKIKVIQKKRLLSIRGT